MPVVTISRQFGAGGYTIGKTIAEKLGYNMVDRGIIAKVAQEANVSIDWVEAVEKEAGGLLMRIVNSLVSSDFIERHTGDSAHDFDESRYVNFLKKVIHDLADEGDVVIIGRGSQFILADRPGVLKVLLVANMEDRIKFMMEHYNMTRSRADQMIKKEEKRRASFLKLLDHRDPDSPEIYDLVINTSQVSLEEAESTICFIIGKMVDEEARPIW